jgi:putative restriction endonuclease
MVVSKDFLVSKFTNLAMWKRGDQRAPHKPLLLLLALSYCNRKMPRLTPFQEIDDCLKKLLIDFGPNRKSHHPEYPFWRLQTSDLWEVACNENLRIRRGNSDPLKSELLKNNALGGFKEDIYDFLIAEPEIISDLAGVILAENFPDSIHEDILQAVSLGSPREKNNKKSRDPLFREKILRAYEYQCAVCGFNVRLGNSLIALEAAHIKWHQAGGPDNEENGVALCALHHKLFDRGAFTVSRELNILVSDIAHGTSGFQEWLLKFHGQRLRQPQKKSYLPRETFVNWHVKEVFQGRYRD